MSFARLAISFCRRSFEFRSPSLFTNEAARTVSKTCKTSSGASDPHAVWSPRPILLLDVDSVINIYADAPSKLWDDQINSSVSIEIEGCFDVEKVIYSPTVVHKINEWNKIAEVRWLTHWHERAKTALAPALKLHDFKLARDSYYIDKINAAVLNAKALGPDGLVIWIDDQLKVWREANINPDHEYGIFQRKNTVMVSPVHGLLPQHCDFIDSVLADPSLSKGKVLTEFEEGYRPFSN